jgi:hypothetical protein
LKPKKSDWLGEAEATVGRLVDQAVETTAELERRATTTMAELEWRLSGFDGRKRAIEQALVAACTESEETLGRAEQTVGWLEQEAAETTAQFERRVTHFDAQKQAIEQALGSALGATRGWRKRRKRPAWNTRASKPPRSSNVASATSMRGSRQLSRPSPRR